MNIIILKTLEEFDSLAEEWNELLICCSASHVPFLRYEYLRAWWDTLGGGEWQEGELHIVTVRDEDGALLAAAPLFFTRNREGQPALMLIGSIEISDYLDLVADRRILPEFIDALFEHLSSPAAPPWKALDLYNLPDESPTILLLQEAARRCGWKFTSEQLQQCPYIPLPGDWEQYLAGIDKKQRHEIRRKMRRAEEWPEPVSWRIIEDENRLDAEIEAFMDLMAQDPEKDRFLTQVMRSQMRGLVHAAFRAGWLQLSFLEVGGRKAAGYLNFDYNGHVWVYNSGLSQEYRELSPGWVLLGYLLRWANENQRKTFDFMRGDEDYKYRFGALNRSVMRVKVER